MSAITADRTARTGGPPVAEGSGDLRMPFIVVDSGDPVFEFSKGLLRGTQWRVDLVVCQEPCCPCFQCVVTWSPVVATATAATEHRLWMDLERRSLERRPVAKETGAFAKAFVAEADAADWRHLAHRFNDARRALFANADLTTAKADFPFAEVEREGLLITYCETFPFSRPEPVTLGEGTYYPIDQYCLNPACSCQDAHLSFCADDPPGPDGMEVVSERFSVVIDLARRTWRLTSRSATMPGAQALVEEYLAQSSPYAELAEHRRVLRALYQHNRRRVLGESAAVTGKTALTDHRSSGASHSQGTHDADTPALEAPPAVWVGRNDPCPCGSGRKYKKCCLNKSRATPGIAP